MRASPCHTSSLASHTLCRERNGLVTLQPSSCRHHGTYTVTGFSLFNIETHGGSGAHSSVNKDRNDGYQICWISILTIPLVALLL